MLRMSEVLLKKNIPPDTQREKKKVKVTQSCLTLCDPMDCTVHGILQARILEWVAVPFSKGSSQPRDQTRISCTVGTLYQLGHQGSPEKKPTTFSDSCP